MNKLEKSIEHRYKIYIITILLIIFSFFLILYNGVNLEKHDSYLINKSGKQRMLGESVSKLAFSINDYLDGALRLQALKSLKTVTDELESGHTDIYSENNQNAKNATIDSLLKKGEPYLKKIITSSKNIVNNPDLESIKPDVAILAEAETAYLLTMDAIVQEYQNASEKNIQYLTRAIYFVALIAVLIILFEFIFVLRPAFSQLLRQNNNLTKANTELEQSETRIRENMEELTTLKTDLETKDAYNKVFIEQAPVAIAMVDNNMCYLAVSQRWITDYKMEGKEFIGRSHYDLFPEIGDDWKAMHQRCLNGAIDINDEEPFIRTDGSLQWIFWDVRPWYNSEGNIGGILMQTGDITNVKENEEERIRIEKILDKTNEVARVGTWDIDLIENKVFWSRMVKEIHGVPADYVPKLDTAINFFKEGISRETISKVVSKAIEKGTSYDVELELVTAQGNVIWTRAIGQAEHTDGKCVRLFGVFQDINSMKVSQIELNKAHSQLQAVFNSGTIAIVSTDADGVINHFNHGAEILTGYSASEMIGLQRPRHYHLQVELDNFRIDIAKLYGKDPKGFSPQLELAKRNGYDTREWTYLRKDGSTLPVQLTLTSLKDEHDNVIGFLGVSTDISDKKNTQNELLRKNQLLTYAEKITMMGNWQWDLITGNVKWSANLYNIFDVEVNAEIGYNTYFDRVHPDDKVKATEHVERAIRDKSDIDLMHRIKLTNGTVKTIQLLAEVHTDSSGTAVEMTGTCQDVTAQRMAENKFRGLLESAPDAMVIVNENGRIQLINKQAERLFGYKPHELFDKSVEILIPKRFIGAHPANREGFFANPETRIMGHGEDLYGLHKSGSEFSIQITLSPLQTEEGLLVSAAIRDITEQKLAERKIINAKENLELLANKLTTQNTQLADFAHITSHNLRAPVSNLNVLLDFYNKSESNEDKIVLFKKFEKVIYHLTHTLDTLVEVVKMKNNDSQDIEIISFDDVLNKTKELLYGQITKSGAVITSDFSKAKDIRYKKVYLESIFLNLLSNAIKYKDTTRAPKIFIESEIIDGTVRLKFKDNGLGIDLEKHGHKLFGLNKVFHRHPEAKGVGLFMTKAHVDSMGGVISAVSKVDEGTTFNINFN